MYYIAYIFILIGVLTEVITKKRSLQLFNFLYGIIFLMAVLRYGQGQDYFNYAGIYHEVEVYTDYSLLGLLLFVDVGYAFLNYIAIMFGFPFELFIAIMTALMMAMFYVFLRKVCCYSIVGLAIFYSVIFMIYPLSIVRQGFCMAYFLCFMYPLLLKDNFKKYYLLLLPIATIHASILIVSIFPLLKKYRLSIKCLMVIFLLGIILMFCGSNVLFMFPVVNERILPYLSEASSNQILAKLLRILLILPMFLLPAKFLQDDEFYFCRSIFVLGFFLYALMSFSELTSSRLWGYFLGFECLLLSFISVKYVNSKIGRMMILYYMAIAIVMWFKDIGGAIEQGGYVNTNMFSYPYISIFEGENSISDYRTIRTTIHEY